MSPSNALQHLDGLMGDSLGALLFLRTRKMNEQGNPKTGRKYTVLPLGGATAHVCSRLEL